MIETQPVEFESSNVFTDMALVSLLISMRIVKENKNN